MRKLLKTWYIPAVLLVLLLLANAARWEVVASKTTSKGVTIWKTDHWTGFRWVEFYVGRVATRLPAEPYPYGLDADDVRYTTENYNVGWQIGVYITSIWLLVLGLSAWRERSGEVG